MGTRLGEGLGTKLASHLVVGTLGCLVCLATLLLGPLGVWSATLVFVSPAVYPDGRETVSVWQEGEVGDLQLQLPV